MKNEKLIHAIGKIDERMIEDAAPRNFKYIANNIEQRTPKSWKCTARIRYKRRVAIIVAACLIMSFSIMAYAVEIQRYNAAVGYLTSLGIEATDLSDYSHQEIKQAVEVLEAGESNGLTEEILSLSKNNHLNIETPTKVTSDQIRELTPNMTYADIICILGETQDIGSGIYFLVYEVDGTYLLNIPLAGYDAQLGVTGEKLLESLKLKE